MKLSVFGPQGSGKGTVGRFLSQKLGIPLIGMGKVLRELPKDHPRYEEADKLMDAGELAPNDLVGELLRDRLSKPDCKDGYILDGYPREFAQFEIYAPEVEKVVLLNISEDTTIKRITGRRQCSVSDKIYNIYTMSQEELAECKGELLKRDDDTLEALQERLEIYHTRTMKVIDYYRNLGIVVEVDAEGPIDEVVQLTYDALGIK